LKSVEPILCIGLNLWSADASAHWLSVFRYLVLKCTSASGAVVFLSLELLPDPSVLHPTEHPS
jgi:hypothetical protein